MNDLDAKQEIFNTAKALFYRNGYAATTMRKIAQASNTSVGLSTYHFGSKENLGVKIYKEFRYKLWHICQLFYPSPEYAGDCRNLSTLSDAALMVETPTFRDFYVGIAYGAEMGEFMNTFLKDVGAVDTNDEIFEKLQYLNSVTVSAVKANIVSVNREKYNISQEDLTSFVFQRYLRLHTAQGSHQSEELFHRLYQEYKGLDFKIVDNFDLEYNVEYFHTHRHIVHFD